MVVYLNLVEERTSNPAMVQQLLWWLTMLAVRKGDSSPYSRAVLKDVTTQSKQEYVCTAVYKVQTSSRNHPNPSCKQKYRNTFLIDLAVHLLKEQCYQYQQDLSPLPHTISATLSKKCCITYLAMWCGSWGYRRKILKLSRSRLILTLPTRIMLHCVKGWILVVYFMIPMLSTKWSWIWTIWYQNCLWGNQNPR